MRYHDGRLTSADFLSDVYTPSIIATDNEALFLSSPCHRCSAQKPTASLFRCSEELCGRYFCLDCLMGRYKAAPPHSPSEWVCFVCRNLCPCHICRQQKATVRRPEKEEPKPQSPAPSAPKKQTPKLKRRPALPNFTDTCHTCKSRKHTRAYYYCKVCSTGFCSHCVEGNFAASICPVCRLECVCRDCTEKNYRKDAEAVETKGADLRRLYPWDRANIYRVNGFWVRELCVRPSDHISNPCH